MLQVVASCINTQLHTSDHVEEYQMEHSDFDGCNSVADGQHQPRSCSHQNYYVTSGIPQHGDSMTVD